MIDPACHRPHVREDTPDDGRCGVTGGVCTAGCTRGRGVWERCEPKTALENKID